MNQSFLARFASPIFLLLVAAAGGLGHFLLRNSAFTWAFFGASIGGFITIALTQQSDRLLTSLAKKYEEDRKLLAGIEAAVCQSSASPWVATEATVSRHREIYHSYHLTRDTERQFWHHSTFDFRDHFPGCLRAREVIKRYDGEYTYDTQAYLVDSRMVIVQKPVHKGEEPVLAIFPDVNLLDRKKGVFGVVLHNDWLKDDRVDPCLLFSDPIVESEGPVSSADGEKLSTIWKDLASQVIWNLGTGSRIDSNRSKK